MQSSLPAIVFQLYLKLLSVNTGTSCDVCQLAVHVKSVHGHHS